MPELALLQLVRPVVSNSSVSLASAPVIRQHWQTSVAAKNVDARPAVAESRHSFARPKRHAHRTF